MVETIEHIPPERLSTVEQGVFGGLRPEYLVMTTPNSEYNPLFDLADGEFRDPDHKFEWSRDPFVTGRRAWRVVTVIACASVGLESGIPTSGSPPSLLLSNGTYKSQLNDWENKCRSSMLSESI